jgi:hypothetical protein
VLQHKGADLFDDSDHNALFATVDVTGFSGKAIDFPAWGSAQRLPQQSQNTTSNKEIARVAQAEQNRKRGLGGLLVANNNVQRTRKHKQRRSRTRKA